MTNNVDDDDDDLALVQAVVAGRGDAFARLYDRYAPLIRAICFDSTGDLNEAQDLSQEAFLRAYRDLGRLRNSDRFGAWMIGITRHVCREWQRGRSRDRRRVREIAQLGEARRESTDMRPPGNDDDDEMRKMHRLIVELPESERSALHVFYLQEQPADAAARVLGLSRSGFYRALDRAKQRLRRLLEAKSAKTVSRSS